MKNLQGKIFDLQKKIVNVLNVLFFCRRIQKGRIKIIVNLISISEYAKYMILPCFLVLVLRSKSHADIFQCFLPAKWK